MEWRCSEWLRRTEGGLHWELRSARFSDTSDVYLYSGPGFSSPVLQLVALFHERSIDAFSHNSFPLDSTGQCQPYQTVTTRNQVFDVCYHVHPTVESQKCTCKHFQMVVPYVSM